MKNFIEELLATGILIRRQEDTAKVTMSSRCQIT